MDPNDTTPTPTTTPQASDFAAVNNMYATLQQSAERAWGVFLKTPAGVRLAEEPAEAELARRGFVFGYINAIMGMTENLFRHKLTVALMPYQFIKWRLEDPFAPSTSDGLPMPEDKTSLDGLTVLLQSGKIYSQVTAEKHGRDEKGYDCLYMASTGNYLSEVIGWCYDADIAKTFTIRADLDALATKAS